MRLRAGLLAAIAGALTLTGCGTAPAALSTPAPEAARSAAQVLSDAQTALAHARSFRVVGTLQEGLQIDASVSGANASGTLTAHSITWQFVVYNEVVYLRGAALWHATVSPAAAASVGDGWVVAALPDAFSTVYTTKLLGFEINEIFQPHPTLVNHGLFNYAGHDDAIKLISPTDEYDVSAGSVPYPLRWLDVMDSSHGKLCGLVFSAFNQPVTITPPVHAAAAPATTLPVPPLD